MRVCYRICRLQASFALADSLLRVFVCFAELVAGQQAMRLGRKAIAQDFLVQKQILQEELHNMTAAQQRVSGFFHFRARFSFSLNKMP